MNRQAQRNSGVYSISPGGVGSESHNNKSSLLLSFKKEESSFLKKRSKRLLFLSANLTVRVRWARLPKSHGLITCIREIAALSSLFCCSRSVRIVGEISCVLHASS